jgi:hypothetical protein
VHLADGAARVRSAVGAAARDRDGREERRAGGDEKDPPRHGAQYTHALPTAAECFGSGYAAGVRPVVVVLGAVVLSGCLGMRTDLDDGDRGETAVEIWSDLPGVTFSIGGDSVVLDGDGDAMTVAPALDGYGGVVRLDQGDASVELPFDFNLDYVTVGYALDERITAIVFLVMRGDDGTCRLGSTNVHTERGIGWAGDYLTPTAPCGPWN